jgi:hypothetical protein
MADQPRAHEVVVFLGPSLPLGEAKERLPQASFLPPVSLGDVLRAVEMGAKVIGIVDGLFEQVLSVWHKEILFALSRGVRVLGASSMGALRAVELQAFGMEGVGAIFEAYARGDYEDDDEVALAHDSADRQYRPLSEPMVNLREGLRRAVVQGLLTAPEHDLLLNATKALFYPERSWRAVRELGLGAGIAEPRLDALLADVRRSPPNVKRRDALLLLERIEAIVRAGIEPHRATFEFEPTAFWDELTRKFRDGWHRPDESRFHEAEDGEAFDSGEVARYVRLRFGDDLARAALGLASCEREAERLGIVVDGPALASTAERIRRERGLTSADSFDRWLRHQGLGEDDFQRLVRRRALVEALRGHYGVEADAVLLDCLRERGEFRRLRHELRRRRSMRARGVRWGLGRRDLLAWFNRTVGSSHPPDELWSALGFADQEAFLEELAVLHELEHCFEHGRATRP